MALPGDFFNKARFRQHRRAQIDLTVHWYRERLDQIVHCISLPVASRFHERCYEQFGDAYLRKPSERRNSRQVSAPFRKVQKGFGLIPNLNAAFSNSPVLLEGYFALDAVCDKGTLSVAERQLALRAASAVNECAYCVAAHSTVGENMLEVPAAVAAAVHAGQPVEDAKLGTLVDLKLVLSRGHVAVETILSVLNAGYRGDQIGEVLIGVALKTISNSTRPRFLGRN